MAAALRYMKNQCDRLSTFLKDPLIPIHSNASEAALRIVALFRKSSLFPGNDDAGRRFMILYSLIATRERHDINPEAYLADVLLRIRDAFRTSRRDRLIFFLTFFPFASTSVTSSTAGWAGSNGWLKAYSGTSSSLTRRNALPGYPASGSYSGRCDGPDCRSIDPKYFAARGDNG
jgi:hypothetical protein